MEAAGHSERMTPGFGSPPEAAWPAASTPSPPRRAFAGCEGRRALQVPLIGRKFIPLFAASFVHSIRCVGTAVTTAEPIQSVGVCWYNVCKNGEHASRSYLARRMLLWRTLALSDWQSCQHFCWVLLRQEHLRWNRYCPSRSHLFRAKSDQGRGSARR